MTKDQVQQRLEKTRADFKNSTSANRKAILLKWGYFWKAKLDKIENQAQTNPLLPS